MTPRRVTAVVALLTAGGLAIGSTVSCDKFEKPVVEPFHSGFVWGPAHGPSMEELAYEASQDTDQVYDANNFCDKCHIGAASQQVADGVYDLDGNPVVISDRQNNWATVLSPLCQDCHPLRVGLDPNFQCVPGAPAELCRYEEQAAHANVNPVNGCTGAACHDIDPPTTWNIGGEDGGGHDEPPLSNIFPLAGAHATVDCTSCHAGAYENDAGKSAYCGNCHDRVGEGETVDHYPPDRDTWTDERERDCKACHADVTDGNGYLVMPNSWADNNGEHVFRVPHHTVQDWDTYPAVVPTAVTDWKGDCASCHDYGSALGSTPYVDTANTNWSCLVSCHDAATLEAQYPAYHDQLQNNLGSCNSAGCHESGTIVGDNEPAP